MNEGLRKWQAAIAASKRQQRTGRWKRKRGLATVTRAGMVRLVQRARDGATDGDDDDTWHD